MKKWKPLSYKCKSNGISFKSIVDSECVILCELMIHICVHCTFVQSYTQTHNYIISTFCAVSRSLCSSHRQIDATVEMFDPVEMFEFREWYCFVDKLYVYVKTIVSRVIWMNLDFVIPRPPHTRTHTYAEWEKIQYIYREPTFLLNNDKSSMTNTRLFEKWLA